MRRALHMLRPLHRAWVPGPCSLLPHTFQYPEYPLPTNSAPSFSMCNAHSHSSAHFWATSRGVSASAAQTAAASGSDASAPGSQDQSSPSSSGRDAPQGPGASGTSGAGLGRVKPTLAMLYTCGKCNTRSAKTFSHQAYRHGVVLVRCPSCESLHLIADNLGWFGEKGWTIERLMAQAQSLESDRASSVPPASTSTTVAADEGRSGVEVGAGTSGSSTCSQAAASGASHGSDHGGEPVQALPQEITSEDMEGFQRVQQLFEVAMRSAGRQGISSSQDTAPEEHQRSSPEESSVIEVSEDDFRAWAVVMRGRIKQ